jgi:hypothetical protein
MEDLTDAALLAAVCPPFRHLVTSGQPWFEAFDRYSRRALKLNARQYARDTLQLIADAVRHRY